MDEISPLISIIIATYNRADTLPRAIDSILKQDYPYWEMIIVDDGSNDNTMDIMDEYNDKRIKIVRHIENKGAMAAWNTGLDHMTGEWFTLLGSDDEMVPYALSTMIKVPEINDPSINAITCNCIDSVSGEFTGSGLSCDQKVGYETLISKCRGEHWGITKSSLLGSMRFNEKLSGFENIIWYKISKEAKRYYIHRGLRIYHTEGRDRICSRVTGKNYCNRLKLYESLSDETDYLDDVSKYNVQEGAELTLRSVMSLLIMGNKKKANQIKERYKGYWNIRAKVIVGVAACLPSRLLKIMTMIMLIYKP